MRFPHYAGVGQRIRERLLALGYRQDNGEPDVARFIRERHYDPRSFYPWINKDRTPTGENLERLTRDLGITPAWLFFGEAPSTIVARRPRRTRAKIAGVLLALATMGGVLFPVEHARSWAADDAMSLIGHRRRRRPGHSAQRRASVTPCWAGRAA